MPRTGDDWIEPSDGSPSVGFSALARAVTELAHRVSGLIDTIAADARIRRIIMAMIALNLAVLLVVGGLGAVFLARLTDIADENHASQRILVECTTPDQPSATRPADRVHECFDAARRDQAAAVAQIVDTNHNGIPDMQEIMNRLNVKP